MAVGTKGWGPPGLCRSHIEDERGFGLHKGKPHQAVLAVFLRASIACVCLYMHVYMYTLPFVTKEVDPDVCSCPKLM